jgi:hypothetical protein
MVIRRRSRIRRLLGFILFRLVPLLLLVAIGWSGYRVVQAVAERVGDVVRNNQRGPAYSATGTAIAPTIWSYTPPILTACGDSPTSSATATSTATATQTPVQVRLPGNRYGMPTNTPTWTATPTYDRDAEPRNRNADSDAAALPSFRHQHTAFSGPAIAITRMSPPLPETALDTPTATESATLIPTPTPTLLPAPALTTTPRPLPTLLIPADPIVQQAGGTAVPTRVSTIDRHGYDLVNILLLGVDDEVTGDNILRTDTMLIVSVNRTTGTVAMLSLPRDLYVYIPNGTMNRLNVAYYVGDAIGWTDGASPAAADHLYNLHQRSFYAGELRFSRSGHARQHRHWRTAPTRIIIRLKTLTPAVRS